METIEFLLKKIAKLVPILFICAFAFWLLGIFFPSITIKNIFNFNNDFVPTPRIISHEKVDVPDWTNRMNPSMEYFNRTYEYNDVSYHDPYLTYNSSYDINSNYIKNLSIKKKGLIYSGMIVTGEVPRSFFALGKFPVFVENMQKNRTFMEAYAVEPWSTSNWVKFQVQLGKLNQRGACNIVFKNANPSGDIRTDIYVGMAANCL